MTALNKMAAAETATAAVDPPTALDTANGRIAAGVRFGVPCPAGMTATLTYACLIRLWSAGSVFVRQYRTVRVCLNNDNRDTTLSSKHDFACRSLAMQRGAPDCPRKGDSREERSWKQGQGEILHTLFGPSDRSVLLLARERASVERIGCFFASLRGWL